MFQIYNGGTTFKQWSKGNKLVMDVLPVGADVLFYNETYADSPIKSDVYEITVDDKTIKVCDVPNALLTKTEKIKVCIRSIVTGKYGINHSMVGPREKYFEVEPADKPSNYVEDPVPTGSGVSSWNQLTDRPFYKENNQTVIEWDGDTEGLECYQGAFYRVSDAVFTVEELNGASLTVVRYNGVETFTLTEECCNELLPGLATVTPTGWNYYAVLCVNLDTPDAPLSNGTYFLCYPDREHTSNLTVGTETIKTIDPEFLPEGYPYKEQSKTEFAILGDVEFGEYIDTIAQANAFVNEEIVVGETYAVVLDGKEYVATAYERTTSSGLTLKMIGNAAQEDGTFDENGPPFCCTTTKAGEQVMLIININAEVGTHTVEIYKLSETIHTMAPEFLPAGVGGGDDFIVTPTMSEDMTSCTLDKTVPEIWDAAKSGKRVIFSFSPFGESDITPPFVLNRISWQGGETTMTEMDFNCLVYTQNEMLAFINFRLDGRANSTTHDVNMIMKSVTMTDGS